MKKLLVVLFLVWVLCPAVMAAGSATLPSILVDAKKAVPVSLVASAAGVSPETIPSLDVVYVENIDKKFSSLSKGEREWMKSKCAFARAGSDGFISLPIYINGESQFWKALSGGALAGSLQRQRAVVLLAATLGHELTHVLTKSSNDVAPYSVELAILQFYRDKGSELFTGWPGGDVQLMEVEKRLAEARATQLHATCYNNPSDFPGKHVCVGDMVPGEASSFPPIVVNGQKLWVWANLGQTQQQPTAITVSVQYLVTAEAGNTLPALEVTRDLKVIRNNAPCVAPEKVTIKLNDGSFHGQMATGDGAGWPVQAGCALTEHISVNGTEVGDILWMLFPGQKKIVAKKYDIVPLSTVTAALK